MKGFFLIINSFLIAYILQMVPMPIWAVWLRPEWILLVLIYWALYMPERIGLNIAFLTGILLDLLMGTPLGQNALAFVLITYVVLRFSRRIELFPLWQQTTIVFCFMMILQTYKFFVWRWLGGEGVEPLYWLSCAISALLWPWVNAILGKCQERYRVY